MPSYRCLPTRTQADLDAAGVIGNVVVVGGETFIAIPNDASEEQVRAARALSFDPMPEPETCDPVAHKAACDAWITARSRLNAVPEGAEYDAMRTRLQGELDAAKAAVDGFGSLC